jgi:hypothetical protein
MKVLYVVFALVLASISAAAQSNPVILPTGLTYGYILTGTSVTETVSVYNVGSADVTVNSVTSSLTQFKIVSGTQPVTLAPGQRQDYGIQFTPATAKNYSGHLTFAIAGQASQNVNVGGYGTSSAAVPTISTTSMTFASQSIGTTSPAQTLTITNNGTATFSVNNVIVTYPFSQTGWSGSTSIAPGKSLSLSVTYFPTATGTQPGLLSIVYNIAPPAGVSLSGTGATATAMNVSTNSTLPAATQFSAYQATLSAVGGKPPYRWRLASGSSLPSGLSLSTGGTISGTLPLSVGVGSYTFTVQAVDATFKKSASATMTLPVGFYIGYKHCNNISVDASDGSGPLIPITDLGSAAYLGAEEGGLYANGSNIDDANHDAYGQTTANAIVPLDANGNYSPTGKYVFISVGLSVAQQPFSEFVSMANTDPTKNPSLVIVNGATGGADAFLLAGVNNNFWNAMIYDYLPNAGVTPQQVVGAWVLDVNGGPAGTFPSDMTGLQGDLESIAQNLLVKFPNIKLAYYSSMNYTGYSDGAANLDPETYAYESGMAVKNAIQDQIGGNPDLNFDPSKGTVKAPWMAWGPYYWANGMIPRKDGLVWTCQDLDVDGTHPSNPVGRIKVSTQLLNFLKTDDTASKWFLAKPKK